MSVSTSNRGRSWAGNLSPGASKQNAASKACQKRLASLDNRSGAAAREFTLGQIDFMGSTFVADCFKPGLGEHRAWFFGPVAENSSRFFTPARIELLREIIGDERGVRINLIRRAGLNAPEPCLPQP